MKRKTKREMMTARQRKTTLFQRRIVIPIPTWGVFVMAGAVGIALITGPVLTTNIISIATAGIAVTLTFVARRNVKALRHDVHEALNNIGNDYIDVEAMSDYADSQAAEKITLKRVKNVNGKPSPRVSGN